MCWCADHSCLSACRCQGEVTRRALYGQGALAQHGGSTGGQYTLSPASNIAHIRRPAHDGLLSMRWRLTWMFAVSSRCARALQDVNDAIEELQKAIFERQGVKGDWGIKCLAVVNTTFKTDAEFLSRFYSFVSKCVGNPKLPP